MQKLEAHKRECAIRYENIEKRLDKGDAKAEADIAIPDDILALRQQARLDASED